MKSIQEIELKTDNKDDLANFSKLRSHLYPKVKGDGYTNNLDGERYFNDDGSINDLDSIDIVSDKYSSLDFNEVIKPLCDKFENLKNNFEDKSAIKDFLIVCDKFIKTIINTSKYASLFDDVFRGGAPPPETSETSSPKTETSPLPPPPKTETSPLQPPVAPVAVPPPPPKTPLPPPVVPPKTKTSPSLKETPVSKELSPKIISDSCIMAYKCLKDIQRILVSEMKNYNIDCGKTYGLALVDNPLKEIDAVSCDLYKNLYDNVRQVVLNCKNSFDELISNIEAFKEKINYRMPDGNYFLKIDDHVATCIDIINKKMKEEMSKLNDTESVKKSSILNHYKTVLIPIIIQMLMYTNVNYSYEGEDNDAVAKAFYSKNFGSFNYVSIKNYLMNIIKDRYVDSMKASYMNDDSDLKSLKNSINVFKETYTDAINRYIQAKLYLAMMQKDINVHGFDYVKKKTTGVGMLDGFFPLDRISLLDEFIANLIELFKYGKRFSKLDHVNTQVVNGTIANQPVASFFIENKMNMDYAINCINFLHNYLEDLGNIIYAESKVSIGYYPRYVLTEGFRKTLTNDFLYKCYTDKVYLGFNIKDENTWPESYNTFIYNNKLSTLTIETNSFVINNKEEGEIMTKEESLRLKLLSIIPVPDLLDSHVHGYDLDKVEDLAFEKMFKGGEYNDIENYFNSDLCKILSELKYVKGGREKSKIKFSSILKMIIYFTLTVLVIVLIVHVVYKWSNKFVNKLFHHRLK